MKTRPRVAERDALLLPLAIAAGATDGGSYLGLGHAFVANMTESTILLGIAVFEKHGDIFHPIISLAWYAAGVAITSLTTAKIHPRILWAKAISWTLLLEGLLLGGAEMGWIAVHQSSSQLGHNVLLSRRRARRRNAERSHASVEDTGRSHNLDLRHLDQSDQRSYKVREE